MIRKLMVAITAAFLTSCAVAATIDCEAQDGGYSMNYSFLEDGAKIATCNVSYLVCVAQDRH